jgi:hypothetical protein
VGRPQTNALRYSNTGPVEGCASSEDKDGPILFVQVGHAKSCGEIESQGETQGKGCAWRTDFQSHSEDKGTCSGLRIAEVSPNVRVLENKTCCSELARHM